MGDSLDENWVVEKPSIRDFKADVSEDDASSGDEDNSEQDDMGSEVETEASAAAGGGKRKAEPAESKAESKPSKKRQRRNTAATHLSSATSILALLRASCTLHAEEEAEWLTDEDIALVESFGTHSAAKLVGFIKCEQTRRFPQGTGV